MARPLYRNPYDGEDVLQYGEDIDKECITRPDQTLSIKEILYRFSIGEPLDINTRPGLYDVSDSDDDMTVDPLNRMDLDPVEIDHLQQRVRATMSANAEAQSRKKASAQELTVPPDLNATTINDDANKNPVQTQ